MIFREEIFEKLAFENHYFHIRQEEGRILNLEEIRMLPETSPAYLHHQEWNLRKGSTQRLFSYLKGKKANQFLDVGCGNGWFLNKMLPFAEHLTGIDINQFELNQASKVLADQDHVELIYGNLFEVDFNRKFDVILLNACVQYFGDFPKLIHRLKELLNPHGEIHIVDSPFYSNEAAARDAKTRTVAYYQEKGVPEMANYYFHHTFEELVGHVYHILFNPFSFLNKVKRKIAGDSPFYWIKITK